MSEKQGDGVVDGGETRPTVDGPIGGHVDGPLSGPGDGTIGNPAEDPAVTADPLGAADLPVAGDPTVGGSASADSASPVVGPAEPVRFHLRRAPRYLPFGLTGALIGVIAGIVLALSFTAASDYSMQTIAGYFAAILGLVGGVLGLGLAVLIERRRS